MASGSRSKKDFRVNKGEKLNTAMHSKDMHVEKMANLAKTLKKLK